MITILVGDVAVLDGPAMPESLELDRQGRKVARRPCHKLTPGAQSTARSSENDMGPNPVNMLLKSLQMHGTANAEAKGPRSSEAIRLELTKLYVLTQTKLVILRCAGTLCDYTLPRDAECPPG